MFFPVWSGRTSHQSPDFNPIRHVWDELVCQVWASPYCPTLVLDHTDETWGKLNQTHYLDFILSCFQLVQLTEGVHICHFKQSDLAITSMNQRSRWCQTIKYTPFSTAVTFHLIVRFTQSNLHPLHLLFSLACSPLLHHHSSTISLRLMAWPLPSKLGPLNFSYCAHYIK